MVFNWFNRKFKKDESETGKENEEKQTQSQESQSSQPQAPEKKPEETSAQTTQEDYLKWAKAAYQQIQQRQATEEVEAKEETPPPLSEESPAEEINATPETDRQDTAATVEEPEALPIEVREEVAVTPSEEPEREEAIALGDRPETIAETVEDADIAPEVEETPAVSEIPAIEPEIPSTREPEELPSEPIGELATEVEATLTPSGPEATPELAEAVEDEIIAETEPKAETAVITPKIEAEPAPEPISTPAWMKKSDGLERLKETAIETPEPEVQSKSAVDFDEDFVWSAKVLAEQGRRPEDVSLEEISWLKRLREGLGKTRRSLINQLKAVVGQGPLNEDAVMEIEALLLQADVGVEATEYIIDTLQEKLREEALPPEEAIAYLKSILCNLLEKPLPDPENAALIPQEEGLNIWLMTGVNGAGKTTTIGKLAHMAKQSGYSCIIAAADTFRAAAVEQVTIWGERSQTQVIANPGKNTDPAAVVYDAISAATSRDVRLLLVDTAGRLQNKKNLMAELAKIRRIIDKKAPKATVESLLVLDATLGQNGLRQAQVFSESAKLSGVILTKLDSSAKGGVALAVAKQLNLPIRFVGAGEGIEDLRPFSSYEFVEALLSE
ncbi:MAG: signal recognition particle-docking protein FtsY [Cyanobacteria bacterium SBLK]|nr:signal recognition particle-docking protein FtsY [Cyanobacteria bacterium SBLK]